MNTIEKIKNAPKASFMPEHFDPIGDSAGGEPRDLLSGVLNINDVLFHVDAYRVTEEDGMQRAVVRDDDLEAHAQACGAAGPFQTVRIDGRDYVLILTPFCQ